MSIKGIGAKRNRAWSQNVVCRILANELCAGRIVNGKQKIAAFLTGARWGRRVGTAGGGEAGACHP